MKANQAARNDRAEVGVGTLIVFIAMVLVAAVAAAVLINTTGTLQQRAQATGKEATQEVSSNLKIANVYGLRNTTTPANIIELKTNIQLSAGATAMDLQQLIVRYSDGTSSPINYVWGSAPSATQFNATWIRGTQGEVMQPGDLVEIHFLLPTGEELQVRTAVSLNLIPETGSSVVADFRTPATFGSDTTITLR